MQKDGEQRKDRTYDLEDRLLEFASRIIRVCETLPRSLAGKHIASQLLRSGTSPYANHAEAESAESRDDFIHKLKLCLKELRETLRWLRLVVHAGLFPEAKVKPILRENDELIRIFVQSVRTARNIPRDHERTRE